MDEKPIGSPFLTRRGVDGDVRSGKSFGGDARVGPEDDGERLPGGCDGGREDSAAVGAHQAARVWHGRVVVHGDGIVAAGRRCWLQGKGEPLETNHFARAGSNDPPASCAVRIHFRVERRGNDAPRARQNPSAALRNFDLKMRQSR